MKFIAILFCTFTMLLAVNYTKKIEIGLCKLINEREMAKFYGDTRNYDALSKKIDGYKFRFGLKDFDEDSCRMSGYYPIDPNYAPYPPYYQNEYERFDRFQRGYRGGYYNDDDYDDGFERGYRRGYNDARREYRRPYR